MTLLSRHLQEFPVHGITQRYGTYGVRLKMRVTSSLYWGLLRKRSLWYAYYYVYTFIQYSRNMHYRALSLRHWLHHGLDSNFMRFMFVRSPGIATLTQLRISIPTLLMMYIALRPR